LTIAADDWMCTAGGPRSTKPMIGGASKTITMLLLNYVCGYAAGD
jgi:hypothetical protein